jgi:hypothetical protein
MGAKAEVSHASCCLVACLHARHLWQPGGAGAAWQILVQHAECKNSNCETPCSLQQHNCAAAYRTRRPTPACVHRQHTQHCGLH